MKFAGIGSRATPPRILIWMRNFARHMAELGHSCRTGGADEADRAFITGYEEGNVRLLEVYLPWPGFTTLHPAVHAIASPSWHAVQLVDRYHPAPDTLSDGARKLHGRNMHIVLGDSLQDPVDFVVCWSKQPIRLDDEGRITSVPGGTGMAVRVAYAHEVPVLNVAIPKHQKALAERFEFKHLG